MVFQRKHFTTLSASILLALGLNDALASGFNVPEISIGGLGSSNAVVANPEMLGAVPYNPSLAAFHEGTTLAGGLLLIHPEAEVTTAAPNTVTNANFQGKDNVFVPNLSLTHRFNEQVTLALNVSVPLGLSTQYPRGTFSTLSASAFPPGVGLTTVDLSPTKSQVEVVDIAPSLAFRLDDSSAVAVGIDYYLARKVAFDTGDMRNNGDGDGWGWNISAVHRAGPWSFGASFRSHAEADISGTTTLSGNFALLGLAGTFSGTSTTLDIPWRAQIGVRYEVSPELALEADITRTGWESFEKLTIKTNSALGTIVSNNNWKNSNAYRLGGTYQLNSGTELRFGYTFDETGMPDSNFSARIGDADRHLFSIGLERQLGDGLAIEAGYMLVRFRDKSFRSTTVSTSDPNGTLAYNGDYSTTVHLFGIGVSKRF